MTFRKRSFLFELDAFEAGPLERYVVEVGLVSKRRFFKVAIHIKGAKLEEGVKL